MRIPFIARIALACAIAAAGTTSVIAQEFPSKPIRLLVGFTAGGGTDTVARLYAQRLRELLDTPVVVENKPGAYETIAAQAVANATPDGYTIGLATNIALILGPAVREAPYDPTRSFTFLGKVVETDGMFVARKDLPVSSLEELVQYVKNHPGELNFGSTGMGSPNHLIPEYLLSLTGGKATHVPYKSDGEVAREVAAGNVDFAVAVAPMLAPFVMDGRINGLAVTGSERLASLPDLPSVMEENVPEAKSLGLYAFYTFIAPAGLPPSVAERLNAAIVDVTHSADIKQRLQSMLFRPALGSPAEVRSLVEREIPKWRAVGQQAGL